MMRRIVNVSGGKDSTAVYLLALERGLAFSAVFADVDLEAPETYDYIRELPAKTGGPPIQWVQQDLSGRFEGKRQRLPAEIACSRRSGIAHCRRPARHPPDGQPVSRSLSPARRVSVVHQSLLHGHAENQADGRTGLRPAHRERLTTYGARFHVVRPLLTWTAWDVFAYLKRHGTAPNPLYGAGVTRVGCWPCIFRTQG